MNRCMNVEGRVYSMSQNTHVGVASDRRPVNSKNVKKRRAQHEAVLNFLKEREEAEKAAK